MNQSFAVILTLTFIGIAVLGVSFTGGDATTFIPAPLTAAHARFVAACEACHAPWGGPDAGRCLACHRRAMSRDTHSAAVLAAPVKAAVPAALAGVGCVTCHREHRRTQAKGYTGPVGFCVDCHPATAMTAAHPGAPGPVDAATCRTVGCHNYHDNVSSPWLAVDIGVRVRKESRVVAPPGGVEKRPLSPEGLAAMRESPYYRLNPIVTARYEIGAHYGGEATCDACHLVGGKRTQRPPVAVCVDCHKAETVSFGHGRHGSAAGQAVSPPNRPVGCGDCHDAHSLRTERAGLEACERCHDTDHVANYRKSGHYRYLTEPIFALTPMKAPDCAGCHMPRSSSLGGGVDHNETLSSASKERMAETVCVACHGPVYALSALYDPAVVASNFTYTPGPAPAPLAYAVDRAGEVAP